jgi:hypothetical protein
MMRESDPPRVAVCVLRVESRGESGILITVTTSADISVPSPGRTRVVAGTGEAIAEVADFLREYRENTPG